VSADVLSWQQIATTLARKVKSAGQRQRGRREISQETVRQIRADSLVMTRTEVASKHSVSKQYVYQIVECGLRDDEREAAS
jgi:hypothetical protein